MHRLVPVALSFALVVFIAVPFQHASAEVHMTLSVDATDAPRRDLLHAHETISVTPGPLVLIYPKWLPGEHMPDGPIADLVGIRISAGGTTLHWRRDLVEMYAIHCDVPAGVSSLDVTFDFILPAIEEGFSAGRSSTPDLLVLAWNEVVLYPDVPRTDSIVVSPSLKLPDKWKLATALEPDRHEDSETHFKPVTLTMLIDSPVLTGMYLNRVDISEDTSVPTAINIASDDPAAVVMSPDEEAHYKRLVVEANAMFGAHHYRHYDFLYTLSNQVAHFGLEHHQSSDDRTDERTLLEDDLQNVHAALLPHEYVHSWNGKYRRPAGLATGNYITPMKDDLLWVYEGLTEYYGDVLTARSGLWDPEYYRNHLAFVAAGMDTRTGRTWRPLQDAADEASILYDTHAEWESYRRSVDFYDEGELIWLDADVVIRQQTHRKKSLNDFCSLFYGPPSTPPMVKPYTFDDVVAALNQVAPYDWRSFFATRLESLSPHAPLGGIENGGWKLVYRDTLNDLLAARDRAYGQADLRFSLGVIIDRGGTVIDVIPGSPAAKAGIIPRMNLVAVNSRKYSAERLHEAVREAARAKSPIELITLISNYYSTLKIEYYGGEKYPYLERVPSKPDILDEILKPLTGK